MHIPGMHSSGSSTPFEKIQEFVRPFYTLEHAFRSTIFRIVLLLIVEQVRDVIKHHKHEKESEAHQVHPTIA
jgi:hypothetical protein